MCKTYRKISRGQVWFLVDPKAQDYDGSIQGKNRPVLIVSNNYCNQNSPVIHAVPLTTQVKNNLPTHVYCNDGKFDQIILCEQVRPVKESLFYDKSYYKYTLSEDLMQRVDEALAIHFGLSLVMPNAERFWKSVEQMVRIKVREAIDSAKVSAVDISKISCLIQNACDEEIDRAIEKQIVVPDNPPKSNLAEQFSLTMSRKDLPKNKWTIDMKKDFVDTYYKYGPQAAADKYNVKLGSAYRLKWNFEKELKDGTIDARPN